jgi:hypothetical protein
MKRTALYHASAIALITASLALAGCKKDADPLPAPTTTRPATTPAPAPPVLAATATVTSVSVGNRVGPDGMVSAAGTTFAPTDTIIASVTTQTSNPAASVSGSLGARWLFEDGQVVNIESKSFTFAGPGTTNFQINKPDGWPAGRYSLEVSLNGTVVKTTQFDIR